MPGRSPRLTAPPAPKDPPPVGCRRPPAGFGRFDDGKGRSRRQPVQPLVRPRPIVAEGRKGPKSPFLAGLFSFYRNRRRLN